MNLAEEVGRYLPGSGPEGGGTLGKVAGAAAVGGILGSLVRRLSAESSGTAVQRLIGRQWCSSSGSQRV